MDYLNSLVPIYLRIHPPFYPIESSNDGLKTSTWLVHLWVRFGPDGQVRWCPWWLADCPSLSVFCKCCCHSNNHKCIIYEVRQKSRHCLKRKNRRLVQPTDLQSNQPGGKIRWSGGQRLSELLFSTTFKKNWVKGGMSLSRVRITFLSIIDPSPCNVFTSLPWTWLGFEGP